MKMETHVEGRVWSIESFLTRAECQEFIAQSESAGYESAPITTASGFVMRPDVRNNARVIWDDVPLALKLWARLSPHFAEPMNGLKPIGLNERFRFYRYDPEQRFAPHMDGSYERPNGEESYVTLILYLNGECEGGETRIDIPIVGTVVEVPPRPGRALLFVHRLIHEGAVVTSGRKYVLRTDVMYEAGTFRRK